MKYISLLVMIATMLWACGGSKKYQATLSEDRSLFAAINELNKRPGNEKAIQDLKVLYGQAVNRHEQAIDVYKRSQDESRFDQMLSRLNELQHIYNSIQATPGAISVVKPHNYLGDIQEVKEVAAEYFYDKGRDLLSRQGREAALQAYQAFSKSKSYISGFKDISSLEKEAYDRSVIQVVVNPIEENRMGYSSLMNWGFDFRYRPDDYQQNLVRDLDSRSNNKMPARFYTESEARRERIDPDWEVNLSWRDLDGTRSNPVQSSRNVSRNVQVGSDTSGKAVYKTVHATLHVIQQNFRVRGNMEYEVRDLEDRRTVDYGTVSADVDWVEAYATYTGDSRALSDQDWILINNANRYNVMSPTRGDILNSLMRELYPQLRSRIERNFYLN